MQTLIKPMCFELKLEALLELQKPRIDKESLMFGFTGSFMIILSLMRILSYLPPCIFPLAFPPTSLLSYHSQTTRQKNSRNKSQKSFLNKNKHMQGWNPKKPTKLDGNDTTTLSHHLYILCHSFCQQCTPQNSLHALGLFICTK